LLIFEDNTTLFVFVDTLKSVIKNKHKHKFYKYQWDYHETLDVLEVWHTWKG